MRRPQPAQPSAATPLALRAVTPDLARGAMLLLIALANAHTFLFGRPLGTRGYPVDTSSLDRVVVLVQMVAVDGRAYPLFGVLVGYGLTKLISRSVATGASLEQTLGLVFRRGWLLLAFGALHGVLLFSGDIIGAYGLITVLLTVPLMLHNRAALAGMAGLGLVVTAGLGLSSGAVREQPRTAFAPSRGTADSLEALRARLDEWLTSGLLGQAMAVFGAVALGAWLAHSGVLDEPARHRPLFRRAALMLLTVAVSGGLPLALIAAQVWTPEDTAIRAAAGAAHAISGYAGAVGYLAVVALVAARGPRGRVAEALRASGQRSMTCYLMQSLVFVAALAAYGGGLGDQVSVAGAAGLAAVTWLGTVAAAALMAHWGSRGPAEALLRRLTYGRTFRGGEVDPQRGT